MTKVEYIRTSHREANRKLRDWLDGVYGRLNEKSRVLGWLWRVAGWVIFGVVWAVGWLAFIASLFRDVRYTTHFMESEIRDLPPEKARQYLFDKQQEHIRRLSYGSVSAKEQKRIDNVFEYLLAKYPASAPNPEEPLPDMAAERHAQVIGEIVGVKTVIDGVAGYTDRKTREDTERQEREAEQLVAADQRRERHRSKSGFEPHPVDFSPKLSDAQFALLTKHMNEIGVFQRDVTTDEVVRLFMCEHTEPLRTTHNKVIALLLERLSSEGLITPKWQQVAADRKCFTSKHGKPLTAKDLSSAKQTAELIPEKKYKMILDRMDEMKRAR